MPGLVSTSSFTELAAELDSAVAWFERMGVDTRKSRLGRYVDSIARLVRAHATQNFDNIADNDQAIKTALYEANEFITIYRRLSAAQYDDTVRGRIARIASGPEHYTDETPDAANSARNYAFELLVMDRLVGGGLALADGVGSDTAVIADNRIVAIECKRLMSDRGTERRFKDAQKQLKRRYANATRPGMRGLIGIDITRAVNPNFGIIRLEDSNIGAVMRDTMAGFVDVHRPTLTYAIGTKTVAALLRLSLLAVLKTEKSLVTYCQHYLLCPLGNLSALDRRVTDAIGKAIANAVEDDHDIGPTLNATKIQN